MAERKSKIVFVERKSRIVVVDDEQPNLDYLSGLLQRLGFDPKRIYLYRDPVKAIAEGVRRVFPDVVISDDDFQIEGMPSTGFMYAVAHLENENGGIRRIFYSRPEDVDELKENDKRYSLGIYGYLAKPAKLKDLTRLLEGIE